MISKKMIRYQVATTIGIIPIVLIARSLTQLVVMVIMLAIICFLIFKPLD